MERRPSALADILWKAADSWASDNVPSLGAALAYYTLFSLAPILVVAIAIGGMAFGAEAVRGQVVGELAQLIGTDGARAIQSLLEGATKQGTGGIAVAIGGVTLLLTATGVFLELQHALNTIFRVVADPTKRTFAHFIRNRLRSFGMVLAIGFLLLVSLMVNAGLAAASTWLTSHVWGGVSFWAAANMLVSLLVVIVLFALIYRFLPDVRLAWRDIWLAATVTATLFTIGKELIGNFLGHSNWTTAYGAAGSVLVLLLWIYYSAQLILYGAEITRQVAERRAGRLTPEPHAKIDTDVHPHAKHPAPKKRRRYKPSTRT